MLKKSSQPALPAKQWEPLFKKASVAADRLQAAKSEKSKTTIIGSMLSQYVGREVPIEVKGRTGKATLRVQIGRAKQKVYFFEVTWDALGDPQAGDKPVPKMAATKRKKTSPPATQIKTPTPSGEKKTSASKPKQASKVTPSKGNRESW